MQTIYAEKSAIESADFADIVTDGDIASFTDHAELSDSCSACFTARATIISEQTGCFVACEAPDRECADCHNVVFVAAIAFCNSQDPLPDVNCAVTDYGGLDLVNPATVKTCMENVEEGDGFVECLGNGTAADLSDSCAVGLDAHIDFRIGEVCNATICTEENLSADCLNCHGAIMVQEIFENAPVGTGACGGDDDRLAMGNVDMTAVIACGSEEASTGATCLAFQAEASKICRSCLEAGTDRAMKQCGPHCADDVSSLDCMS